MKPNCECCGSNKPVAEITNPAVGDYTACYPCLTAGRRPPCYDNCGRQSELMFNGKLRCAECYDAAQEARRAEVAKQMEARQQQLQAEVQAQIEQAVAKALAARGL